VGSGDYDSRTQFLFTGLNQLKPDMIAEATRNAREVAEKFARDSDSNTPHIKKVRVVATLEYYLTD